MDYFKVVPHEIIFDIIKPVQLKQPTYLQRNIKCENQSIIKNRLIGINKKLSKLKIFSRFIDQQKSKQFNVHQDLLSFDLTFMTTVFLMTQSSDLAFSLKVSLQCLCPNLNKFSPSSPHFPNLSSSGCIDMSPVSHLSSTCRNQNIWSSSRVDLSSASGM